jgi:hypothetical protein
MEAWHLVIDDGNADRVIAAADVTMKHVDLLSWIFAYRALTVRSVARRRLSRLRRSPEAAASPAEAQKNRFAHGRGRSGASLPKQILCGSTAAPLTFRSLQKTIRECHASQ